MIKVIPTLGNDGSISWDAFGYYYYFKLAFIDHSMILHSLDSVKAVFEQYDPSSSLYQFTRMPDGKFIVRYPVGQAILYLPFFLIAHLTALVSDFPADGFSRPYEVAMRLGALLYHFLGFVFVARLLRRHFADKVVAIVLIVLLFGTNAYAIIVAPPLSAQGTLFFLIPLFMVLVDRYFRNKNRKDIFIGGFVFGLICLSRPTDFITIIPALLWPATIPGLTLKTEWLGLLRRIKHLLLFIVPVAFCAMIQFSYWKYAGGSWIIDSYGSAAEGLDFLSPHTIPFLFSFKSGWLLYTPIMALVLIYLVVRSIQKQPLMTVVLIYSVIFIYIASSWTNWWYGGGFSQRAMVQAYALLSIPLAGLIDYAFFKRGKLFVPTAILIIGFTGLSIWQTYQYKKGVLNGDTVTPEYYFASFFDSHFDPDKKELMGFDHYDIYINPNYGLPEGYELTKTEEMDIPEDRQNTDGREYFPYFKIKYRDLTDRDHCFLLLYAVFEGVPPEQSCLVTTFNHGDNYGYQCRTTTENVIEVDSTTNQYTARAVYLSPHIRDTEDQFSAYLWNKGKQPGKLIRMWLEVYEKRDDRES